MCKLGTKMQKGMTDPSISEHDFIHAHLCVNKGKYGREEQALVFLRKQV